MEGKDMNTNKTSSSAVNSNTTMVTESDTSNQMEASPSSNIQINGEKVAFQFPPLILNLGKQATVIAKQINEKKEPAEELCQYAEELKEHCEELSEALDNLPIEMKMIGNNLIFGQVADQVTQEYQINNEKYGMGIFEFIRACLSYILPLRLHDYDFLKTVTEVMLNNDAHLYCHAVNTKKQYGQVIQNQNDPLKYLSAVGGDQAYDYRVRDQDKWFRETKPYGDRIIESAWTDCLLEGDYLDVLKNTLLTHPEEETKSTCRTFSRAKIVEIEEGEETEEEKLDRFERGLPKPRTFTVCLLGELTVLQYHYEAKAVFKIGPLGMYTSAWDWRMGLQQGDWIDCCDEYHTWFTAFVIEIRDCVGNEAGLDIDGKPVKEAKIGFRYYDEEYGTRQDPVDKRMYVGWGTKYDSWRKFTCTSIHPAKSIAGKYVEVKEKRQCPKNDVLDKEDILYLNFDVSQPLVYAEFRTKEGPDKQWHELARSAQKLSKMNFLVNYLNEFGKKGGFHKILELIKSYQEVDCPFEINYLTQLLKFLAVTCYHWQRQFATWFIPELEQVFTKAILTSSGKSSPFLKTTIDEKKFLELTHPYEALRGRYYTDELLDLTNNVGYCKLAVAVMKQDNLEKRIKGLKLLTDQLRLKNTQIYKQRTNQLCEIFQEAKIFELLFQAKNFHAQMVSSSQEIAAFYAQQKIMTPAQVEILWETSQREESDKIKIYAMISEIAWKLEPEVLNLFMSKVSTQDAQYCTERDLGFLFNLSSKNYSSNTSPKEAALDVFFNIAIGSKKGYSQDVQIPARKHLIDLVKTCDRSIKDMYVIQCIQSINNLEDLDSKNQCFKVQAYTILQEIIQGFPKYNNIYGQLNLKDSMLDFYNKQDILTVVLKDLRSYVNQAKKLVESGALTKANVATFEIGEEKCNHQQNLAARLSLLYFIQEATDGEIKIEAEQLDQLQQDLLIGNGFDQDRKEFFTWFKKVLAQKTIWIKPETVSQFFQEKVIQRPEVVHRVNNDGFICITQMFLLVNEYRGSIDQIHNDIAIEEKEKKETNTVITSSNYTSNSNYMNMGANMSSTSMGPSSGNAVGTSSKTKNYQYEFRVHISPNELEGVEIIWQMFQHANSADSKVKEQIVKFLAQIYESTSIIIKDKRSVIYQSFIDQCFNRIQQNQHLEGRQRQNLIINTLNMLKGFFVQTEMKGGTMCLRQHKSVDKEASQIKNLLFIFENLNEVNVDNAPKFSLLNVDSSLTVWELYNLVAKQVNKSPLSIILHRVKDKDSLLEKNFCQTLAELKVEDSAEFYINNKFRSKSEVPLSSELTKDLTVQARYWFTQWFEMYSVDDEELGERVMTRETCSGFFDACARDSTKKNINVETREKAIKEFFLEDRDHDEKLKINDFLRFYKNNLIRKSDAIWKNLQAHEIGYDLNPEPRNALTYKNDDNVTRDQSILPRCQIANNPELLEVLFKLDEKLDTGTSDQIWDLIASLKTNRQLYMSILTNDEQTLAMLSNPQLLAQMPIHKLLYLLQIIKYLLQKIMRGQDNTENMNEVSLFVDKPIGQGNDFPDMDEKMSGDKDKDAGNQGQGQGQGQNGNFEGDHWQGNVQPSAGDKDEPVAATNDDKNDADGKPSSKAESANFRKIREWKGDIKKEKVEHSLFTKEESIIMMQGIAQEGMVEEVIDDITAFENFEQLHKDWLVNFLEKDGFKAINNILTAFIGQQQARTPKDTLNVASESKCLKLTAEILKVILVGCFSANGGNEGLITNLQRKMSSQHEDMVDTSELKPKAQHKLIQQKSSVTTAVETHAEKMKTEYKNLVELLQNAENPALTEDLVAGIDQVQFMAQMETLLQVVLRKENIKTDEVSIVSEILNVWTSFVSFEPSLLKDLYANTGANPEQPAVNKGDSKFVQVLIDQGLLGENSDMRDSFKEALLFVCQNIRQTSLPTPPAFFFLQVLLGKLDFMTKVNPSNTLQYFELFSSLTKSYFKKMADAEIFGQPMAKLFDEIQLLHQVLSLIENYESKENKANSEFCDNTLVGLLNLATEFLSGANEDKKSEIVFQQNQANQVTQMILNKLLFGDSSGITEEAIASFTKQEDLVVFEKAALFKCHNNKSRESAYKLFLYLVNHFLTIEEFDQVVRQYWTSLVMRMEKPEQSYFDPSKRNRAENGYAGLKNLGATCYQNSMIQQFFNVPIFRYSLMCTDDGQAPNVVEHEGRKIDDNLVHQFQRLFATLELTDRQDYNTKDFMFSYKDQEQGMQPVNVRTQKDAREYVETVFDRLETGLKSSQGEKYLCQNVFQGETASLQCCKECGHISQRNELFYFLTTSCKDQKDLHSSLKELTNGEIINDFRCESCNKKVDVEKKMSVKKLPNTLIVNLQRLDFDMETMQPKKINDKFEFPKTLNMRPYMLDQVVKRTRAEFSGNKNQKAEEQTSNQQQEAQEVPDKGAAGLEDAKEEEQEDTNMIDTMNNQAKEKAAIAEEEADNEPDSAFEYKLVGVLIHMGTHVAGHYLSYINVGTGQYRDENGNKPEWNQVDEHKWLEFNDDVIKPFDIKDLEEQAFGETIKKNEWKNNNNNAGYQYYDNAPVEKNKNAYMLIYEKREKSLFKINLSPETVDQVQKLPAGQEMDPKTFEGRWPNLDKLTQRQILGCDSSAHPRRAAGLSTLYTGPQQFISETDSLPFCFKMNPLLLDMVKQNKITYDESNKEYHAMVVPRWKMPSIPIEKALMVALDNHKFVMEKQVFSASFYDTSVQLFEKVILGLEQRVAQGQMNVNLSAQFTQMYQIIDKFLFELASSSRDLKVIPQLTDLLLRLAFQSEETFMMLCNNRIFVEQDKLAKDQHTFFEEMIFHRESEVRQMHSDILQNVFSQLMISLPVADSREKLEMLQEYIMKISTGVMRLMPDECKKAWWKLDPFFDFFKNLICKPEPEASHQNWKVKQLAQQDREVIMKSFIDQKVVMRLVDLITCYVPSEYETVPPFNKAIEVIATIVCQVPVVLYLYGQGEGNPQKQPQKEMVLNACQINELEISPYYVGNLENLEIGNFIGQECINSLFLEHSAKHKKIFKTLLANDHNPNALAYLLGHLCWNNVEFSRRIGKLLVNGMNESVITHCKSSLRVLQTFLTIPDDFQGKRHEWICGIADFEAKDPPGAYEQSPSGYKAHLFKAGLGKLQSTSKPTLDDMTYKYMSYVIKDKQFNKDTLCTNMYQNRNHSYDLAVVERIGMVLETVANPNFDKNHGLLRYLLTLEGPSYLCRRYWDWFEPWVHEQIQKNTDNQEKLTKFLKMNDDILKVKRDNAELFGDPNDPETKALLESGPGGRPLHEPYIVWETMSKRDNLRLKHDKLTMGMGNFEVMLDEMAFNVTHSLPTGTDNQVVNTITNQFGSNNFALRNQEAANVIRKTSGRNAKGKKTLRVVKPQNVSAGSKGDGAVDEPEAAVVGEAPADHGGSGDAVVDHMDGIEDDVALAVDNIMDTVGVQPDDMVNGDIGGPIDISIPEATAPEDVDMNEEEKQEIPNAQDEAEEVKVESSEEEQSQIPVGLSDYKQVAHTACVIVMRNFCQMPKTVVFKWNYALKDQLNLRLPLTDWTCQVNSTNDKILFRFTKLDPLKPWGPIDQMYKVENYNSLSIRYEGGGIHGGYPPEQPVIVQDEPVDQPAVELNESGEKICGACTMGNVPTATQCFICETFF